MDLTDPEVRTTLIGRMGNFPLSVERPLLPLFEAITNSIQAIEDARRENGEIIIRIEREHDTSLPISTEVKPTVSVSGFTIEDNGIGFDDDNFASFCTLDTMLKKSRGGKGVGRLAWLKAFEKAEVDSVFQCVSGPKRRKFVFTLTDKGFENYELTDAPGSPIRTTVRLATYHRDYQARCPKQYDTIARHIIDHFLSAFVLDAFPNIRLIDEYEDTNQSLTRIFEDTIKQHSKEETVELSGSTFHLHHFRLQTRALKPDHQLHFCARSRSVETRDLGRILTNLKGPLHDDTVGQFEYAGYVSGEKLDSGVNQERTRLDLLHEPTLFTAEDDPIRDQLIQQVAQKAEAFLEEYLAPIKESKLARINEFVQLHPRFRPLLKLRPDWLNEIRSDVTSDDDLHIELYKLMHRLELEVRTDGIALRRKRADKVAESIDDHKRRFEKFLDESNQVGFSKLAEYVIHRRAVIDYLSDCMKYANDDKYRLEEEVHEVIFPMKSTSDTVPDPDQSNLWMIDERLSYHYYLSSDNEFSKTEIDVKARHKKDRVDLLVLQPYDRPHAFVGTNTRPFDSVTIVEFKRPMRNDFNNEDDDERDPIAQVWGYARKIQQGTVVDKTGQQIKTGTTTQFFAYIVCNITEKMIELADFHGFTPMPDNLGYFTWQKNYRVYTEIIDYQKLIQDAKKRNEVFFHKFNLPPTS